MTFDVIKDGHGNRILVEKPEGIEFALVSKVAEGRPGNDFHNPATGQFTFAPPGVDIITGSNILKQLTKAARDELFRRASQVNANQLAVRIIDGKVSFVLLRDGRRLHSYSIGSEGLEAQPGEQQPELAKTGGPIDLLEFIKRRDAVVEAARQLDLTQTDVEKFLKQRAKRDLSDIEVDQLVKEIRAVQVNDLVDYLWYNIESKTGKVRKDIVRIATPRGYLRKSFANVTEEEARFIIDRLRDRGVEEEDIERSIVGKLPQRLRKFIEQPHKEEEDAEKTRPQEAKE
jgi:hypothetical protein